MEIIKIFSVFGLGSVALWLAIVSGIALKLGPWVTFLTSSAGAIAGVIVILVFGERIRTWLLLRYKKNYKSLKNGRIYKIWKNHGVEGFGMLAPTIIGAPIGIVVGLALGAPRGKLLFWISVGILIYSGVLTLAISLGIFSAKALF